MLGIQVLREALAAALTMSRVSFDVKTVCGFPSLIQTELYSPWRTSQNERKTIPSSSGCYGLPSAAGKLQLAQQAGQKGPSVTGAETKAAGGAPEAAGVAQDTGGVPVRTCVQPPRGS